jgi:uncharacterized protein (TIGR00730 family)
METICVYCGSSTGNTPTYVEAAEAFGERLGRRGYNLVYGGASIGIMGAVADAAMAAGAQATGVMPESMLEEELAHQQLDDLRIVESMHERKATMADLSDAFVALPGGLGTLEELFETWTWAQLGYHRKPCSVLNIDSYWSPLLEMVDHAVESGFVDEVYRRMLVVGRQPDTLLDRLENYTPPTDKFTKLTERSEL